MDRDPRPSDDGHRRRAGKQEPWACAGCCTTAGLARPVALSTPGRPWMTIPLIPSRRSRRRASPAARRYGQPCVWPPAVRRLVVLQVSGAWPILAMLGSDARVLW